ncbi:MAG: hypothetical protein Q4C71_03490 [Microbacteriaceae bacterium]|nr:hypothetical protein [Microbacteriaceae bacterium]
MKENEQAGGSADQFGQQSETQVGQVEAEQVAQSRSGWVISEATGTPEKSRRAHAGKKFETVTSSMAAAPAHAPATAKNHDSGLPESGTAPETEQMSSLMVMLLGILGGLYLLYTLGWFTLVQEQSRILNIETRLQQQPWWQVLPQNLTFWSIVFAPVLWFGSAMIMLRKNTSRLLVALLVGAVVLVPIPVLLSLVGG